MRLCPIASGCSVPAKLRVVALPIAGASTPRNAESIVPSISPRVIAEVAERKSGAGGASVAILRVRGRALQIEAPGEIVDAVWRRPASSVRGSSSAAVTLVSEADFVSRGRQFQPCRTARRPVRLS